MPATLSLKQRAYDAMLDRIMGGDLAPGDLLNRRGMAVTLAMSSAPVHEAMIQLERDGLLEALPRRGTRVRMPRQEDVWGHLVVREALECQVARMICGEGLAADLKRLTLLARQADEPGGDNRRHALNEVQFHVALAEVTRCPALVREYRRIMQQSLFLRINLLMPMPVPKPVNRHLTLVKKLRVASPAVAEAYVREHVWSGKPESLKSSQ